MIPTQYFSLIHKGQKFYALVGNSEETVSVFWFSKLSVPPMVSHHLLDKILKDRCVI